MATTFAMCTSGLPSCTTAPSASQDFLPRIMLKLKTPLVRLCGIFAALSSSVIVGFAAAVQPLPFTEEFSDNSKGWPRLEEGATWTGRIQDGVLLWENTSLDATSYENLNQPLALDSTRAFEIAFAVRSPDGLPDREFGLEWGVSGDRGYGFVLRRDGQLQANNWDGAQYLNPVPWEPLAPPISTEFTRCVIRKIGEVCYYFVGDEIVTKIPFTTLHGPAFGFFARSGVAAEFDYLRVRYLEGDPKALLQQGAAYDAALLKRNRAKGPAAVDFTEEFDDNSRAWSAIDSAIKGSREIAGGQLVLSNAEPERTVVTRLNLPINSLYDFELSWRAKCIANQNTVGDTGLRWGLDADGNFQEFSFRADGGYQISGYKGGKWTIPPPLNPSMLKPRAFNLLAIRFIGGMCYYSINGQMVAALPRPKEIGPGLLFAIGPGTTAAFDSLRLAYLPDRTDAERAALKTQAVAELVKNSKNPKLGIYLTEDQRPRVVVVQESPLDPVHHKHVEKLRNKYRLKEPESFMADYGRPVATVSYTGNRVHQLYYNYKLIGRQQWYYGVDIGHDSASAPLGGAKAAPVRRWIENIFLVTELPPNAQR